MRLEFAPLSYDRPGYGLPGTRLVNMFPEGAPGKGTARLPRPCLELAYSLGASGIRGLYQQDGVFGGDIFAVSGTTLYRGMTSVGTVALTAQARFAASYTQLVVVAGGIAYCYDGSTLTPITFPNAERVIDVAVLGTRFVFVTENSDLFYWSDLDDATTVDPLSFATADAAPDASLGIVALGERAMFLGKTSAEFWGLTGDPDAPLQRLQGSTYTKGCASIRSVVQSDNRVFWCGSDLKIYTLGAPNRVSTHSIEQRLRQCATQSDIHAFAVSWDGHDLILFNVPGQGTFAYHVESNQWMEWTSHGRTTFRCSSSVMVGSTCYLGDADTGAVYTLADAQTDAGDPVEWIASVIAPAAIIHSLELEAAVGVGLEDNSVPLVEMRDSIDGARTWSAWRPQSLGLIGDYTKRPIWRRLGLSKRERVIEFRTTSPVRSVYAAVRINEQ